MTATAIAQQPAPQQGPQLVRLIANQLFEVDCFDSSFQITGFDRQFGEHPEVKDYFFKEESLMMFMAWYKRKGCKDGYYIHGTAGCGKTSLPEQIFARLNIPVYKLECHETSETTDFLGTIAPSITPEGQQLWVKVDGPLYKAVKYGGIFIADEFDRLPPGMTSMLHDILDGKPLHVPSTGEVLKPHPLFKLIATGNSSGSGDELGIHPSVQHQDAAIFDRFWSVKEDYLDKESELAIMERVHPNIPRSIAGPMIDVANDVRSQHISKNGQLPLVFSTRTLLRWAEIRSTAAFLSFKKALEVALTNRASNPIHAKAILDLGEAKFGDAWD